MTAQILQFPSSSGFSLQPLRSEFLKYDPHFPEAALDRVLERSADMLEVLHTPIDFDVSTAEVGLSAEELEKAAPAMRLVGERVLTMLRQLAIDMMRLRLSEAQNSSHGSAELLQFGQSLLDPHEGGDWW